MHKLILPTIILTFFFGCSKPPKEPVSPPSLVIGDPVDYGLKDLLLFPVGGNYNPPVTAATKTAYEESVKADRQNIAFSKNVATTETSGQGTYMLYDKYASAEYMNQNENDIDIRNIIFYSKTNGESYPLHSDTFHILSFAIHHEFKTPLIFYRLVRKDLNADGKYNSNDPVMFCASNAEGKSLVMMTPEDEKFLSYSYYPETRTILVKTAIDSNHDKEFGMNDETNFREVKLDSPSLGREIFTKALIDQLKMQLK
jgi:hypothetical protein